MMAGTKIRAAKREKSTQIKATSTGLADGLDVVGCVKEIH